MPSARSGSSGTAPGSPGGKSAPVPPAIVHHHSSSSSTSSASTVKTSSPLNPARTLSPSPHTTPPSNPKILAPSHSDPPSYESTPKSRPRVSSTSSVPRGRGPSPLRESDALQITRVTSNPLPDTAQDVGITPRGFSLSSFRSRSRSTSTSKPRDHSPEALTVVGEDLRASVLTPVHAWWHEKFHPTSRPWSEGPKRKKTVPAEQTENYLHTKERVVEATASVLGVAARVTHEALFIGVDFLKFAPVPALEVAGVVLLNIWEAVEMIEMNRLACLRLTERCAETLISVREEIQLAGVSVARELQEPIDKLQDAFKEVHVFLQKQGHRPFLHRYLKRDEIQRSISHCDASLNDALDMFSIRVQIRTLKLVQANEARRQQETDLILDSLGLKPLPSADGSSLAPRPSTATNTPSAGQDIDRLKDPQEVQKLLHSYRREQNNRDRVSDMADLRQLMRTALQTNNDATMIEVLQIARDEMPEAIKTLQRALEREVERERYSTTSESSSSSSPEEASPVYRARGRASRAVSVNVATLAQQRASVDSSDLNTSSEMTSSPVLDTLDREFIETGIDALRRLSQGTDLAVPSWTITRYEVELDEKIGIGFFSDVYKGQWRDNTVAIKVLAETTPRKLFVHEIGIWKKLDHPNVLELLGASSATCDPPWFLVSPYYKNGNLVEYLRGLGPDAPVDALKMMHQISKGMSYLHGKGILHGDLKGTNVLVDDRLHCVISDFGQSEMKSEVFRLSRQPTPHGTLRWQSPELMRGAIDGLTPGVDVYAFGILCVEILSRGALPWPIADDEAVRRFVIEENKRPSLPLLAPAQGPLTNIIQSAWNRDPLLRPTFLKIERDLRSLRRQTGAPPDSPRPPSMSMRIEEEDWARSHHQSPDMRPNVELPSTSQTHDDMLYGSASSGATGYETATSQAGDRSMTFEQVDLSRKSSVSTVRTTTTTTETTSDSLHDSIVLQESMLDSGFLSPIDPNSAASEFMNERRYRMLLQHDYHTTLTLPLWTPAQVRLGAVGYISKPEGSFVTLFNSMDRLAPDGTLVDFPSFSGYGRVATASLRLEKRNAAERGIDMIRSFLSSKRKLDDGSLVPAVSRTQPFQLRSGHKVAYMYAESTAYRYMEDITIPKRWFEANIDGILAKYGRDHKLTRGDVFLVIGSLEAQDYAMFVSHTHPDGQINFNVFSGPRPGDPWGEFVPTTAAGPTPSLVGPVYDGEGMGTMRWAHKVSRSRGSLSTERWDSVLLARLRFKPDASEPTRL